jgi:hypothetical protein
MQLVRQSLFLGAQYHLCQLNVVKLRKADQNLVVLEGLQEVSRIGKFPHRAKLTAPPVRQLLVRGSQINLLTIPPSASDGFLQPSLLAGSSPYVTPQGVLTLLEERGDSVFGAFVLGLRLEITPA